MIHLLGDSSTLLSNFIQEIIERSRQIGQVFRTSVSCTKKDTWGIKVLTGDQARPVVHLYIE